MEPYCAIKTICHETILHDMNHMTTYRIIPCDMNYMLTYGISTAQYEPYVNIWNHIAYYKSLCQYIEPNCTIWIIWQHIRSYRTIWIICWHMESVLYNMNHMSRYETILHITNLYVIIEPNCTISIIWQHNGSYRTIWIICWNMESVPSNMNHLSANGTILRNINHMLTNENILRNINSSVNIWILNAQHFFIFWHIIIMCSFLL